MDYLGQHPVRTQQLHPTLQGISHHSIHQLIRHSSRSRPLRHILHSHIQIISSRQPSAGSKPPSHRHVYRLDPDREGKWRIARRVAPDRTISVVDPEARHGRKTSSQRRDGYKAHVAAEPDTGIVTACEITSANAADGPTGVELLEGEPSDTQIIADSAYGSGETRATLEEAGHKVTVKPIPQRRDPRLGPDQFTRDDFTIDHQNRQVTCPANNTATIGATGLACFGVVCAVCPHRSRCTTSKTGRYLKIHPHDRLLTKARQRWKQPETVARYNHHRPAVERIIAWMVANGNRKLKYRGIQANRQQLHTRVAAINLRRLINLGLRHTPTGWATNLT